MENILILETFTVRTEAIVVSGAQLIVQQCLMILPVLRTAYLELPFKEKTEAMETWLSDFESKIGMAEMDGGAVSVDARDIQNILFFLNKRIGHCQENRKTLEKNSYKSGWFKDGSGSYKRVNYNSERMGVFTSIRDEIVSNLLGAIEFTN